MGGPRCYTILYSYGYLKFKPFARILGVKGIVQEDVFYVRGRVFPGVPVDLQRFFPTELVVVAHS